MFNVQNTVQTTLFLTSIFTTISALTPPLRIAELSLCLQVKNVSRLAFVPRSENSKRYNELNYQWNTVSVIEPAAYVLPETAEHVRAAILCGRELGIRMVAKSGGHSYGKYSFGDNSSVVIDLRYMRSIHVDKRTGVADVGPAVLIGELLYAAWQNGNFVTPVPLCVTVGFGGAAQGGGYGYLSKKLGLMSDSILAMDMVDASGNFLRVTSKKNPDLFWALRGGGGGNFGIVTKFTIQLHDASMFRYKYVTLEFAANQLLEVLQSAQIFCLKTLNNKSAFLFTRFPKSGAVVTLVYVNVSKRGVRRSIKLFPTPTKKSTKSFSEYVDLALLDTVSARLSKVEDFKNRSLLVPSPVYSRPKTFFVSKIAAGEDLEKLAAVVARLPPKCSFAVFSLGGAINRIPKDATAFVHRDSIFLIEVKVGSNESEAMTWVNDLNEVMQRIGNGESYQNIIDTTLQYPEYLTRYYGSNLKRLQEIKEQVDPANYFEFPQSIKN